MAPFYDRPAHTPWSLTWVLRRVGLAMVAWLCPPVSPLLQGRLWAAAGAALLQLAASVALVWALHSSSLSPLFLLLLWVAHQTLLAASFWVGLDLGDRGAAQRLALALPLVAVIPITLVYGLAPWTFVALQAPTTSLDSGSKLSWVLIRTMPTDLLRPGDLVAARCPGGDTGELLRLVALPEDRYWLRSGQVCHDDGCLPQRHLNALNGQGDELWIQVEVLAGHYYFVSSGVSSGAEKAEKPISSAPLLVKEGELGLVPDVRDGQTPSCLERWVVGADQVVGGVVWGGSGLGLSIRRLN